MSSHAVHHAGEVARAERFEFGRNWQRFLEKLDEERIEAAEHRGKRGMFFRDDEES
jgi:hypothetical protein